MCIAIVVASMLMVVGADAYLTQGQVRLTRMQGQLTSDAALYRDLQLRVATLANPNRIVSQAEGNGLGPPGAETDLPAVTTPPPASGSSQRSRPSSQSTAGR